jgi:hypothetical protein
MLSICLLDGPNLFESAVSGQFRVLYWRPFPLQGIFQGKNASLKKGPKLFIRGPSGLFFRNKKTTNENT